MYTKHLIRSLLMIVVSAAAIAQAPPRIVRLTAAEGSVHIDQHDNGAGDPAQVNMPLVEGQSVVTGGDGQAEMEFEDGSLARIAPNSSVTLSHLGINSSGNASTELTLGKGLAYFTLRAAEQFTYQVVAGQDRITPIENATVRVANDQPPAVIAALDGNIHVEHDGSYSLDLPAGQTLRADASGGGQYQLTQHIDPDSWDQWNEDRDRAAADAASTQTAARNDYAGDQGYGWSDLDTNGTWYDMPGQGNVWQPNGGDAEDFDPYGNGSWVWNNGGGYLWASSYSWGWTPFRCGGWSYWDDFGWGWQPNSACGAFGFAGYTGYGFGGGIGGFVNVVRPPQHYVMRHLTSEGYHGGPGAHPILRVHHSPMTPAGPHPDGPRRIAGVEVLPLGRIAPASPVNGVRPGAIGSTLRRDFPVDRSSHTPVLGVQPSRPPAASGLTHMPPVGGVPHPIARPAPPLPANAAQPPRIARPAPMAPRPMPAAPRPMPAPMARPAAPPPPAAHPAGGVHR
ncbi:MAG TPA: FecR family protein [Granulicella sp.]